VANPRSIGKLQLGAARRLVGDRKPPGQRGV